MESHYDLIIPTKKSRQEESNFPLTAWATIFYYFSSRKLCLEKCVVMNETEILAKKNQM